MRTKSNCTIGVRIADDAINIMFFRLTEFLPVLIWIYSKKDLKISYKNNWLLHPYFAERGC